MTYLPEESMVIYQSKDGKEEKVFDVLEWPRKRRRDASTRCHAWRGEAMRRRVFPYPEQGRTDGALLWLL